MGVPIFFVLSGFLISYTVFKSGADFNWKKYGARRFAKIIPPFYLSILVFALVKLVTVHPPNLLLSMIASATTWESFRDVPDLCSVYWTLYIEIHFYLVLPLVYLAARKMTKYPEYVTFLIFLIIPSLITWSIPPLPGYSRELWIISC